MRGEDFVAISAGGQHTCALRDDGNWKAAGAAAVSCRWTDLSRPSAAGSEHTCALREDGSASCWGNGDKGQASPPSGRFTEIAAGYKHSWRLARERRGRVLGTERTR